MLMKSVVVVCRRSERNRVEQIVKAAGGGAEILSLSDDDPAFDAWLPADLLKLVNDLPGVTYVREVFPYTKD